MSTDVCCITVQARYEAGEIRRRGDEDRTRRAARPQVEAWVEMNIQGALHQLSGGFKDRSEAEREGVERGGEDQHPCAEQGHYAQVYTPTPGNLQYG